MSQAQQRPEMDEMYTFPPPRINQVSPQAGKSGDSLTVKGEHLASVENCSFKVGNDTRPGRIVRHSDDNEVTLQIPGGLSTGSGQVWVANNGGESNKFDFSLQT